MATRFAGVDSANLILRSREAANKALEMDPDSGPARVALASLSINIDRDLEGGARQMLQALRLAPGDYTVQSVTAALLGNLGRRQEAFALTQSLAARDPANPGPFVDLGNAHLSAGRFDEAIASYRRALQLSPGRPTLHANIATCLIAKGDPRAALAEMQLEPEDSAWRKIGFPAVWHALGEDAKAEAALAELIRDLEKDAAYNIAYVQARLGHTDAAFEWLDKAVAYRDPGLSEILFDDPEFAAIRDDPRWLKFLQRLGRAPEQLAAIEFDIGAIAKLDAAKP